MRRFDLDQSPESRLYLEQFAGSPRYFSRTPPASPPTEALKRLQSDDISLVLEIPPGFGRTFAGAPHRKSWRRWTGQCLSEASTVAQYVQGVQKRSHAAGSGSGLPT